VIRKNVVHGLDYALRGLSSSLYILRQLGIFTQTHVDAYSTTNGTQVFFNSSKPHYGEKCLNSAENFMF
jgi:hypothetical protein